MVIDSGAAAWLHHYDDLTGTHSLLRLGKGTIAHLEYTMTGTQCNQIS